MGCTPSKVAPTPSAGSDGASAAALTPIWKPVLRENVPHQTQTALEPTIVPPVPHSSDRLAANVAAAGEFRGLCGWCGQVRTPYTMDRDSRHIAHNIIVYKILFREKAF